MSSTDVGHAYLALGQTLAVENESKEAQGALYSAVEDPKSVLSPITKIPQPAGQPASVDPN